MARPLTFPLDTVMQRPKRRPHSRVLLYDTRSTSDTIGFIVRGLALDPLTGPLDITDHLLAVDVDEQAGDFAASGVPATKITLLIADETPGGTPSRWDPQFSADDEDAPARFLRKGNTVRLFEGDLDVDPGDWPNTFTGKLVGQPGVDRGRAVGPRGRSVITMSAVSREAPFANLERSSDDFARGTTYLTMGDTVAREDMDLDADEIEFSAWGGDTTGIKMQFIEQSPLVTLAQLMFVDGFSPRFTGEGKLSQTFADIGKAPARVYLDSKTIRHIAKPFTDADAINHVEVLGIKGEKEKTTQPPQPLAEVEITTGYFTSDEEIFAYWTDDRTQLAEDIELKIHKSVNGGLSVLGGGETWDEVLAEGSTLTIGAKLNLSTGFAPYLVVYLTVEYVAASFIPDEVTATVVGFTFPIGRVIEAILLAAILLIMSRIGRGQYTFWGRPVEYLYKRIEGHAEIDGLLTEELRELVIENDLVQTQAQADASALMVLYRQQARANPRSVLALHDVRLEPHDIFEIADGRRFLIEKISRTLIRNAAEVLARYSVFEVSGVTP